MNIKDFLIDNYIWILAIILITIVTIIGFLADKKKSAKKKETKQEAQNVNTQPVNNQTQIQYQNPVQLNPNEMNLNNQNAMFQTPQQNTTIEQQTPPVMTTQPQPVMMQPSMAETTNNPQPVENIAPNMEQEPMYQPTSEQKPVIAPRPVPNYTEVQNQMQYVEQPQPITEQPINTMNQQQIVEQPYNMASPTMMTEQNNSVSPSVTPNIGTIPQLVNPIPTPQPVIPQPIMSQPINDTMQYVEQPQLEVNFQNVSQPMPTYNNQTPQMQQATGEQVQNQSYIMPQQMQPQQNTFEQPNVSQQPSMPAVNFVYGPQNSNNQNM